MDNEKEVEREVDDKEKGGRYRDKGRKRDNERMRNTDTERQISKSDQDRD